MRLGKDMHPNDPLVREIARNLDDAIHRLNQDLERVEIWTAALSAFLEAVPDYDSLDHEFLLPRAESGTREGRAAGEKHASQGLRLRSSGR
jgi:hypothetical protein